MAANAPMIIIQTGRLDGRLNASKTPVRIAEPSVIEGETFNRYFWIRNSKVRQAATDVAVTIRAPMPEVVQ